MRRVWLIMLLFVGVFALSGCSGRVSSSASGSRLHRSPYVFVPAGAGIRAECRRTARALGYPVPCLSAIPRPMSRLAASQFIGRGRRSWRRWAVGSTYVGLEHLVATASPHALANDAKVVNGPAWFPGQRVKPLDRVTIGGWHMRVDYVPPATNDGSAFMHHVVLVWTADGHTYAFGFHDLHGIEHTLLLDEALARHVTLVSP